MSLTRSTRRAAAAAVVCGATLAAAPAALASDEPEFLSLRGGSTAVTLDAGAAAALDSLGVSVAPSGPARVGHDGAIRFPIPSGEVNSDDLTGQIRHWGGLTFTAGDTELDLDRYDINVDAGPDLSARINDNRFDRAEIFDLDLTDLETEINGRHVTLSGVVVKLSATGAAALNATFDVDAFAEGLVIGTAETNTRISRRSTQRLPRTLRLRGGATTLSLDPATAGALDSLGVEVGLWGRAQAVTTGVAFPVSSWGTRLHSDDLSGKIRHRGGLDLTAGSTSVSLRRYEIRPSLGRIDGNVQPANIKLAPLFSIDASEAQSVITPRAFRLTGVKVSLTETAADLLNSSFGVDAFAEGTPIGTAVVDTNVRNRRGH